MLVYQYDREKRLAREEKEAELRAACDALPKLADGSSTFTEGSPTNGQGVKSESTLEDSIAKEEALTGPSVARTVFGCFSLQRNIPLLLAPVREGKI